MALAMAGLLAGESAAEAVPVELRRTESGWQLLRGGEPYFIRGAGGEGSLEALAAAGANSVRTWGGDPGPVLDAAHELGMTVTVGLWLGHARHGFDYSDERQVAGQLEAVRELVLRYRDHPALLVWGLGNEMEGFEAGDDLRVWAAVEQAAAMVKELDPHHPTMTVTAFVHGSRIEFVHRRCPSIDIHGINAYGGAPRLPELLRAGGAVKPFILTEYGPPGPWEAPTTDWGAPLEPTSAEKARYYRETYASAVLGAPGLSLGSYAFLWGHKLEGTETWLGLLLEDGSRTAAVHALTELWTGRAPGNRAPVTGPVRIAGAARVQPEEIVVASADIADPDGDPVEVEWALRPESGESLTGGDYRRPARPIEGAIVEADGGRVRVRMPEAPGAYRLFVEARDGAGNAATANVPLLVLGEPRPLLPFSVYDDGFEGMPWAPSGWMGATEHLSLDGAHGETRFDGESAIRIRYEGRFGWAGIAWQHPPDNWGDRDGGFDLRGASALEVWARGEWGGEKVGFGVGLIGADRAYPDSGMARAEGIVLTPEWRRYVVPLDGVDLSRLRTGFVVTLTGRASPVTVYLDRIRFIR